MDTKRRQRQDTLDALTFAVGLLFFGALLAYSDQVDAWVRSTL